MNNFSFLCSAAASEVCFASERVAGLDVTETGNELSRPKFEFKGLVENGTGKLNIVSTRLKLTHVTQLDWKP